MKKYTPIYNFKTGIGKWNGWCSTYVWHHETWVAEPMWGIDKN